MYPLNVMKPAAGNHPAGFAVANDESEHKALSDAGYLPALVVPVDPPAEPVKTKAPAKA